MANKPSVKIDYAIMCDDIRQETNGKLIVIGIYSTDIIVPDCPSKLFMHVLLHGKADVDRSVNLEVRYRAEFKDAKRYEVLGKGDLQITFTEDSNEFFVPMPRVLIEIRGVGNLSVHYRIDSKRWKALLKKNIKIKGR